MVVRMVRNGRFKSYLRGGIKTFVWVWRARERVRQGLPQLDGAAVCNYKMQMKSCTLVGLRSMGAIPAGGSQSRAQV